MLDAIKMAHVTAKHRLRLVSRVITKLEKESAMNDTEARQKSLDDFYRRCTCVGCDESSSCPYAWDGYNTDGDCLAEK
jgi:hypothetical protein